MSHIRRRPPRAKLKGIPELTRDELIFAIRAFSEKLEKDLPPQEITAGWSLASQATYLEIFRKLETDLMSGANIPYLSIGRSMDHSGIEGGDYLEEACRISVALDNRKW